MEEAHELPLLRASAQPVFSDTESMRARVRQAVLAPSYNVHDFYKETGCCQAMVRNHKFERLETASIIAYMVLAAFHVMLVAHFFLGIFALGWLVRLAAFKRKLNSLRDGWFVYDGSLVFVMVLEMLTKASPLGAAVIAMLGFKALVRFARYSPELMILLKGLRAAVRSIFSIIVVFVFVVFCFAFFFERATQDTLVGQTYFHSTAASMYSLLVHGILLDGVAEIGSKLSEESRFLPGCFFLFIFIGVLLIVISMLAVSEVLSVVAAAEKEAMCVDHVRSRLADLLSAMDVDTCDYLSKDLFLQLLQNPEAARILQEVGVDVVGLVDLSDDLFKDSSSGIVFSEFLEFVLKLRGSNMSTANDIVALRRKMDARMDRLEQMIESLGQALQPRVAA